MSTTSFVPPTLSEEFAASGATITPFKGLTVTTNEPTTSAQLVFGGFTPSFASPGVPTTAGFGKIADPTGAGTPQTNGLVEVGTVGGDPNGTIFVQRMTYTAPTLPDGESTEVNAIAETATSLLPGGPLDSNVAVATFTLDTVTAPGVTGTIANQPDDGSTIQPWAALTKITDHDFKDTGIDTATITVTDAAINGGTPTDADGLLTGIGLSKIGVGTYSIPNPVSPSLMQAVLSNLKFTPSAGAAGHTTNFKLAVTDVKANLTHTDTTTSVVTPGSPGGGTLTSPTGLTVVDTTTGLGVAVDPPATPAAGAFTGATPGITEEYVNINSDNLNISTTTPNWFLHSGSGEDAIDVSKGNGTNVLDGGTGSNFLVGGSGHDTFFVDDRNAPSSIWSTVTNFHSGDDATIFGVTKADFSNFLDGVGAVGHTGLTADFNIAGKPDARMTLAGFTSTDLTNGKLTTSFGTEPDGTTFMLIHAN